MQESPPSNDSLRRHLPLRCLTDKQAIMALAQRTFEKVANGAAVSVSIGCNQAPNLAASIN